MSTGARLTAMASLDVAVCATPSAPPAGVRAVGFAAHLAATAGAVVRPVGALVPNDPTEAARFPSRLWGPALPAGTDVGAWASAAATAGGAGRLLLVASTPGEGPVVDDRTHPHEVASVEVVMDPFETEATLFARSGLADLLGDPARAPLVPGGRVGSGAIGYAAFAALSAVWAAGRRWGRCEQARLTGEGALSWVNWKAMAAASRGSSLHRRGDRDPWPMIRCGDGWVVVALTDRDWKPFAAMVASPDLDRPELATSSSRLDHPELLLDAVGPWFGARTRAEITDELDRAGLAGAAVLDGPDLFDDPHLVARHTFVPVADDDQTRTPVEPHRVEQAVDAGGPTHTATTPTATSPTATTPTATVTETSAVTSDAGGDARLPLDGIRVVDLGIITAGSGTSALLADLGAQVLKVESPERPDPFRRWAGSAESPLFPWNNRNKDGVALDLKEDDDRAAFFDLVAGADVVVENFRRGVLDRLGVGFDELRAVNPTIVLASLSSQGATGPGAARASYGSTLEAASGLAALTSYGDGRPYVTGSNVNFPDQIVCLHAAAVTTIALLEATEQQRAIHVDISQRDVAIQLLASHLESLSAGDAASQLDDGAHTMVRSLDDRWVVLAAPDADRLASFADNTPPSRLAAADLVAAATGHDIGAAVVRSGAEVLAAALERADGTVANTPSGLLVKGFPFQCTHVPLTVRSDAPAVGEHTDRHRLGRQPTPRS